MIKKIFLLIALVGCYISSTGVLADKDYQEYRNEDDVKEEDEFVTTRIRIKQPSANKRSYSRPSTLRRCGKGSGKGGRIGGCITSAGTSTGGTSTAEGQETTTLDLPEFQLTLTFNDEVRRRRLQSTPSVDVIYNSVKAYLESALSAVPVVASLKDLTLASSESNGNTVDAIFRGSVITNLSSSITQNDITEFLVAFFTGENEKKFLVDAQSQQTYADMKSLESVQFNLVSANEDASNGNNVNGENDGDMTGQQDASPGMNDGSTGWTGFGELSALDKKEEKDGSKTSIKAIFGAGGCLLVITALLSYGYRRAAQDKEVKQRGYELSDDLDIESELQPTSAHTRTADRQSCEQVMKSRGLNDFDGAYGQKETNRMTYLGKNLNKAWTATRNSMSDLAAGATQEEFAENGMKIDVYGSSEKKRNKRLSPLMMMDSKKGGELFSELAPIVEVDSAVSGSDISGRTESWQEGNGEINKAPPLLPAFSASSASSDNGEQDNMQLLQSSPVDSNAGDDFSFNYSTPVIENGSEDNLALIPSSMDGMTPYADMAGINDNPNISDTSNGTPMRCLDFGIDTPVTSELDSNSDRSSSGSCVKEMLLEAINPDASQSDKSSDGCVKDMLEAMDDCLSSPVNQSEGGSGAGDDDATEDFSDEQVGADEVEPQLIPQRDPFLVNLDVNAGPQVATTPVRPEGLTDVDLTLSPVENEAEEELATENDEEDNENQVIENDEDGKYLPSNNEQSHMIDIGLD